MTLKGGQYLETLETVGRPAYEGDGVGRLETLRRQDGVLLSGVTPEGGSPQFGTP